MPGVKTITLAWRDSVPWSNVALQNPWHVIYRGTNGEMDGELQKYDSIRAGVDSLYYIDDNLNPEVLYHYRVKTRGTYGNPAIALQENFSQTAFSYPVNDLKPCRPIARAIAPDCDEFLAQTTVTERNLIIRSTGMPTPGQVAAKTLSGIISTTPVPRKKNLNFSPQPRTRCLRTIRFLRLPAVIG